MRLIASVAHKTGHSEVGVSVVTVFELSHGIARAGIAERRARRQKFLDELMATVSLESVTPAIALRAGLLDGECAARGVRVPFSDLLIGVTALELGFAVGTANVRHFALIPGLAIVQL